MSGLEVEISDVSLSSVPKTPNASWNRLAWKDWSFSLGASGVNPGEHVTFKVSGLDQYGQSYPVANATWSAQEDCTVSGEGGSKPAIRPASTW